MESESARTAVVCESVHHGNTQQIAGVIADVLHARVMTPQECDERGLDSYRLVGFGSGIYFGRHHRSLRRLAAECPKLPKCVFIFSTAGLPCFSRCWHASLRHKLAGRGCCVVGEFTCRGWDTVGPLFLLGGLNRRHPNHQDLADARAFAQRIRQQCPS